MVKFCLFALVLLGSACVGDPAQSSNESPIADPTPAAPGELLAVVKVKTVRGMCSGTLIATDTVLTAAHCFCTEAVTTTPHCRQYANQVVFLPDPAVPNAGVVTREGPAIVHPDYKVSAYHRSLLNDLAVVHLTQPAPSYVTPLDVGTELYPTKTDALMAGFGDTGLHCQHNTDGSLNYDIVQIDEYQIDDTVMFNDERISCHGDSGGPILDMNATTVYGVVSNSFWYLFHGWVDRSMAVPTFFDWIKENTCDRCSSKANMCRCGAGVGDCDTDADCEEGLHCAQDVGASFGLPPTTDVCVPPGPPEGTCKCRNSGAANICTSSSGPNDTFPNDAFEACSASYHPVCNPLRATLQEACGVCTCEQ